jgi:small conductance mechanosensitive channel
LGDSSVNFTVRAWAKVTDFWPVFFAINEQMKKTFDAEGITIPFPQRDVHLYQQHKP